MAEFTSEEVFLAEKILDSGFGQQDGKRYYKIRWVRYTWEAEDSISHLKELLEDFWTNHGGDQRVKEKDEDISTTGSQDEVPAAKDPEGDGPPTDAVDSKNEVAASSTAGLAETTLAVNILLKQDNTSEIENAPQLDTRTAAPDLTTIITTAVNEADDRLVVATADVSDVSNVSATATHYSTESSEGEEKSYVDENASEKEELICQFCLKSFTSLSLFKSHVRLHASDNKTFQCDTCGKSFVERSTLKRHLLIHLENKPFKCENCDRSFSDRSTLRRHVLTHTGHKRFQCAQCDKKFTRNEHLRQHMYIHTAEKLYKCEVCGKDFRQRSTLKNHMLLHRVDHSLKCDNCGAMFSRQQLYDKHITWCHSNMGEFSGYRCEICDKVFKESGGLKRHQMIHTGEKPFTCDVCGKSFNDRSILRRHCFIHTERKPFHCTVCDKEFIRKASLVAHMAAQHAGTAVYEFVQPVGYEMESGEISLANQNELRFVIATDADSDSGEGTTGHVEVSSGNVPGEGVAVLANAVCDDVTNTVVSALKANVANAATSRNDPPMDASQSNVLVSAADVACSTAAGIVVASPMTSPDSTTQVMQFRIVDLAGATRNVQALVVPSNSAMGGSGHTLILNPQSGADVGSAVDLSIPSVLLGDNVATQAAVTDSLTQFSVGSIAESLRLLAARSDATGESRSMHDGAVDPTAVCEKQTAMETEPLDATFANNSA